MKPTKRTQKTPLKKHSFQKDDLKIVETKKTISTAASMPFSAGNFKIMLIGVAVLLLGFLTMTLDSEEFGQGFIGMTLGPVIVVIGFAIQFFAIFHTPKIEE